MMTGNGSPTPRKKSHFSVREEMDRDPQRLVSPSRYPPACKKLCLTKELQDLKRANSSDFHDKAIPLMTSKRENQPPQMKPLGKVSCIINGCRIARLTAETES